MSFKKINVQSVKVLIFNKEKLDVELINNVYVKKDIMI